MRPNTLRLTRRDVARIQAHAEAVAANPRELPAALADLDAPVRVGAVPPDQVRYFSGERLGEWAGMTLLYWRIPDGRAREAWRGRVKARQAS